MRGYAALTAACITMLLAAAGLRAQTTSGKGADNQTPPPAASPGRAFSLAVALADAGRADKDPLKLLAAARMMRATGIVAARADATGQAQAGPYDAAALLTEAAAAAKDDPLIRALIEDSAASALKGRTRPGYSFGTAKAAGTDWFRKQPFKGGAFAEVTVTAVAGTGFDLFIYDAAGNLICRDLRQSYRGYCGWKPAADGTFDIKIENRSATPLKYTVTTN